MPTHCALLSLDHKLIRISDSRHKPTQSGLEVIIKLLWLLLLSSWIIPRLINFSSQALAGLERMQELVGKNLNNIVGNLWQRQETETGSGSSHGNIVSRDILSFISPVVILFCEVFWVH